jgi:hypothetical protein
MIKESLAVIGLAFLGFCVFWFIMEAVKFVCEMRDVQDAERRHTEYDDKRIWELKHETYALKCRLDKLEGKVDNT